MTDDKDDGGRGGPGGPSGPPADGPDRTRDIHGPQDPLVDRFRPEPGRPPERGLTLKGFLGDSDREGHRRLYLTKGLDYYVEFRAEDAVDSVRIPPEQPPFIGAEATEVTLRKGADIAYTHSGSVRTPDEFDLDVRRVPRAGPRPPRAPRTARAPRYPRAARRGVAAAAETFDAACGWQTWEWATCASCDGTCVTCEDTCPFTCEATCSPPSCGGTCHTCGTCERTGCTGCCPLSLPGESPCGPSEIETACETCGIC
ncbi:hypothetical protein ACFVHB_34395 [Kitasatospora sp. NPDC127111]|uniref:hypothetical protein n=1 Tax=Kitasatospora sp. NPDC127111 TaxID=3345363 RepID=UPI0036256550